MTTIQCKECGTDRVFDQAVCPCEWMLNKDGDQKYIEQLNSENS